MAKQRDSLRLQQIEILQPWIGALPGFRGFDFGPLPLLKAVNFLRVLGLEESLALLDSCCQSAGTAAPCAENVLLIARLLFEPKDPYIRPPAVNYGQPDIGLPADPDLAPLFPIHLVRDCPFLLVGGYRAGGEATQPSQYLSWCAREAAIRAEPLAPNPDVLGSVDLLVGSNAWKEMSVETWHVAMLRSQALRALERVLPVTRVEPLGMARGVSNDDEWREYRETFDTLKVVWNPLNNEFETTA